MDKRIVKIPMPVALIRQMDEALSRGRGGLETREQFIREAVEGLLAEVSYAEAPPEPTVAAPLAVPAVDAGASHVLADVLAAVPPWEQDELRLSDLAATALPPPPAAVTLGSGIARCLDEPLLGIHNRDYPSLWAAHRLARYTEDGPIRLDEFRRRVASAAWFYGTQLGALEESAKGLRLTALFPTNAKKREAAEQAFQTFAVAEIPRRPPPGEDVKAGGPLFAWRMCQLQREGQDLLIGLTAQGLQLLDALTGLSLELPHGRSSAERFLHHLVEHAPGERWGFERILTSARREPNREELVAAIAAEKGSWTAATVSSVAQGYVARAREWGLLEPRLRRGRYLLTDFGDKWQQELAGDGGEIGGDQEVSA